MPLTGSDVHGERQVLGHLLLVDRGDRLAAFLEEYAWRLDSASYWRVLASLWIETEHPSDCADEWCEAFTAPEHG